MNYRQSRKFELVFLLPHTKLSLRTPHTQRVTHATVTTCFVLCVNSCFALIPVIESNYDPVPDSIQGPVSEPKVF
jgi:hypothetical protein